MIIVVEISCGDEPGRAPVSMTARAIQRSGLETSTALGEVADVLARPKFRRFISTAIAVAFIDGLATGAIVAADPPEPPSIS